MRVVQQHVPVLFCCVSFGRYRRYERLPAADLLCALCAAYTLIQVAVNDLIMLALYVPIVMLLLGVSDISLPYDTVALSVAFFIGAPLVAAGVTRVAVLRWRGAPALERLITAFKPVTTVFLLATLVLVFIYQGETIGDKPVHILLIAVCVCACTCAWRMHSFVDRGFVRSQFRTSLPRPLQQPSLFCFKMLVRARDAETRYP
jgi:ACR3 family arsenite efflux pump ArsB